MTTYQGHCHCGAYKFEVTTDLSMVVECNCSHCYAAALLCTFVSEDKFKITQGDESKLTTYLFNKKQINHKFCPTCGIQFMARGKHPDGTPTVMVNVRCLEGVDKNQLKLTQYNGKDS